MQTEKKLAEKKSELLKLISRWAKREKILQPGEVIEIDIRVVKNSQLVVLTITGEKDLAAVRAMSVERIGLSTRTINALFNRDIVTVGRLADSSYRELMGIRNFGKKGLSECIQSLEDLGIRPE